jgi:hypothetical protein
VELDAVLVCDVVGEDADIARRVGVGDVVNNVQGFTGRYSSWVVLLATFLLTS